MRNVCITGASGYIGGRLAEFLAHKKEVERIVGVDIRAPERAIANFRFVKRDIRERIDDVLTENSIDTLVHTAYVLSNTRWVPMMEDINVNGTKNVLTACARNGVQHVVYTSSATAYGFHADNDNPLTEESPLRANADFTYGKNKREIELAIREWLNDNPGMRLTVLRPCFVVGPGFDNPFSRHLRKKVVIVPAHTERFQFVHADDLIRIIETALAERKEGVYNVGADGTMSFEEMVKELGGVYLGLPKTLCYLLNAIGWTLRLQSITESANSAFQMLLHPWVISSEKLKKDFGFTYRYTTRTAFADFAASIRAGRTE